MREVLWDTAEEKIPLRLTIESEFSLLQKLRMGKLKDNTISGTLPTARSFAVHYPGYPSSKRRAIETLGGTQSILKVQLIVDIKSF